MDDDGAPDDARDLFAEVTDYIGFGPEDAALLRGFLPVAEPHFARIAARFYAQIASHPQAQASMTGGAAQAERLVELLIDWLRTGLAGPHDQAYCSRRARIGLAHVRLGLPQRYMIMAMSVIRLELHAVAREASEGGPGGPGRHLEVALDRLCDLELAIMLEAYALEVEDRLRRRERLATIGQLAASVGHDLRNPLSVIESSLYILRGRVDEDPRASRHVERIADQIKECDAIITHLLEMARDRPPQRGRVDAAELVDRVLAAMRVPEGQRLSVARDGLDELELWVDEALLKQALINVVLNAIQAQTGADARLEIVARVTGDVVTLTIADEGPGFDPQTLATVFEQLVTTKVGGTGLGLALVKRVVERHGGQVRAQNQAQGGAVITLHLPGAVAPEPRP